MDTPRVSDMTVEELTALLRGLIRDAVREALAQGQPSSPSQRPPLELPLIDVGPWPEGVTLSREEWYDDNGR